MNAVVDGNRSAEIVQNITFSDATPFGLLCSGTFLTKPPHSYLCTEPTLMLPSYFRGEKKEQSICDF